MPVGSEVYFIFLGAAVPLYLMAPARVRWAVLLAAGLVFYGFGNPVHLVYLVLPVLLVYGIARTMDVREAKKTRRTFLILGVAAALAELLAFKYADFFRETASSLAGRLAPGFLAHPFRFAAPLGISFLAFRLIGYLIDVYRRKIPAERHLGFFVLFASFFPQVTAGPIERAGTFLPELRKTVAFDAERVRSGLQLAAWGLFKKLVIADRLAVFVNGVFSAPEAQGLNLLFAAWFYSYEIYCDFSGYTDMAIGLSRILGIRSAPNFDNPYGSRSVPQFWSRWHISLSTWLRDYLFLPISYSVSRRIRTPRLAGVKAEVWAYAAGASVTMFLAGLWHGARWTMIAWGLLYAVFLIFSLIGKSLRKKVVRAVGLNRFPGLHKAIGIIITFNLVSMAWVFFRSETLSGAFLYLKSLSLSAPRDGFGEMPLYGILVLLFILVEAILRSKKRAVLLDRLPPLVRTAGTALLICLLILFAADTANEFIYAQF